MDLVRQFNDVTRGGGGSHAEAETCLRLTERIEAYLSSVYRREGGGGGRVRFSRGWKRAGDKLFEERQVSYFTSIPFPFLLFLRVPSRSYMGGYIFLFPFFLTYLPPFSNLSATFYPIEI